MELKFFAWHGYRGMLYWHRFLMAKDGKVAAHEMKCVARELGQWCLE